MASVSMCLCRKVSESHTRAHTVHGDCDAHVHSTFINKELIVGSTCQCKSWEESTQGRDFFLLLSNFIMCCSNFIWSRDNHHYADEPL